MSRVLDEQTQECTPTWRSSVVLMKKSMVGVRSSEALKGGRAGSSVHILHPSATANTSPSITVPNNFLQQEVEFVFLYSSQSQEEERLFAFRVFTAANYCFSEEQTHRKKPGCSFTHVFGVNDHIASVALFQ